MKTILLASAPNEDGIKAMIAKYWCTNADCITLSASGSVLQGGKEMTGFRVVVKRGRFRFEGEL